MTIKIDLEKAYDKIEWKFIKQIFFSINTPNHLISLILSCMSSSKLVILFNGKPTEFFEPSRVSPYPHTYSF